MASLRAGMSIVCCGGVSREMPTPSALRATSTLRSSSVLLLTLAANWARSSTTKKRGVTGRIRSGLVATRSLVLVPSRVSPVRPTPRMTQVVKLSGRVTVTLACPASSVRITGSQKAVSANSWRISTPAGGATLRARPSTAGIGVADGSAGAAASAAAGASRANSPAFSIVSSSAAAKSSANSSCSRLAEMLSPLAVLMSSARRA